MNAPQHLTIIFVVLTLVVALADVAVLTRAAPKEKKRKWFTLGAIVTCLWLALHAGIAESGVLEGTEMPPPVMLYLMANMAIGLVVVRSALGRRLASVPLAILVGLQTFRLPLEWLLHSLYGAGALPVQMTWSGYNFDVVTGATAPIVALALWKQAAPRWVVWAWNIMGFALLLTVVTLAVLSVPLPMRQFTEGPPVVLPFHAPFNWIVNVHVWTALVGHLVIFRALRHPASQDAIT
ncbi:MAG: hypothetical protein ACE366_26520 [Bradymonadia bacterium]